VLAACIGLAACGGSSSSSSTGANAAATNAATSTATTGGAAGSGTTPAGASAGAPGGPTGATGHYGNFASHFAALRECLQKNGVTSPLPQHAPGQGPTGQGPTGHGGTGRGGFFGGSTGAPGHLPAGVSLEKVRAALKKCGGGTGLHRFGGGFGGRFNTPSYTAALTKFSACMRENGIDLPAPNTAGSGPVFNTKGLDASSPKFIAAEAKCRSVLRGSFRPGAGGPPGAP
jgi:hypothetical protein